MRTAEVYLVCLTCKRIPEWTKMTSSKNENGEVVKHYEFKGVCPFCNGTQFQVVEVRSGSWQQSSASNAMSVGS